MKNKLFILFGFIQIFLSEAKSQVYSTGVVPLSSTSGLSMTIKIDISTLVTLTLTGPSDRWFSVGFNASNMASGTDVVSVHSNGTLSAFDCKLTGYNAPVSDVTQNWSITSNQISSGVRTVVATRSLNTGDPNDYIFNAATGALSLIWARASSATFNYNYHGSTNRGMATSTFSLIPSTATLNMNVFIDGYYNTGSSPASMVAARYSNLEASGSSSPGATTDVDMITVQLRSASNIEVAAYSVNAILQTNGTVQCVFPSGALNGSYYIVVLHRASNPLWSASPVTLTASSSYSFSNSQSSAYGMSPMHQLLPNLYGIWLGEMNDDDYLDASDFSVWETDQFASESGGYLLDGDFNGDSFVDPNDFPVFDFNSLQGIGTQRP